MAFMQPQYTTEPFITYEDGAGESIAIPLEYFNSDDAHRNVERIDDKHWCRLSAPGYMDCTDWEGPFDSLEEAKEHITNTFMVDADTGAELEI